MKLSPIGKANLMRGQEVRPSFRTNLSPLVKTAQADNNRPTIEEETLVDPSGPQAPGLSQEQPDIDGPKPSNPGVVTNNPNGIDPTSVPEEDKEKQEAEGRSHMFKLREEVREYLRDQGLQFDSKSSSQGITFTVKVRPHVRAESDGQWYRADQVMAPVIEKLWHQGFDVNEPNVPLSQWRKIDPSAEPLSYAFTYSKPKGGNNSGGGNSDGGEYTIPNAPSSTDRNSSKMGVMPSGDKAAQSISEMIRERKDDLVAKLGKIAKGENSDDEDPCWKGYEQIGMKDKNGKKVPNCVKKTESETKYEVLERLQKNAKDNSENSDPCWENYEQKGMKDKDGKKVPNCVKKSD